MVIGMRGKPLAAAFIEQNRAKPGSAARVDFDSQAPVAQGIERCPAEAEVASSNLAGRIAADLPLSKATNGDT
jgi:hypothetical protein